MTRKSSTGGAGGSRADPRSVSRGPKVRVKTARRRNTSSTRWLQRQLNDPYVAAAKREGYRSRAAYKLLELNERFGFLKNAARVVDLGAAPGGWTQVVREACGPTTKIVGIDLLEVEPVEGAKIIKLDFLAENAERELITLLEGPADVVLSDMAAASTGHQQTDHMRTMALCEAAFLFAIKVLAPGGAFVAKVLRGGTEDRLLMQMKQQFRVTKHAKPPASRADSTESYIIALGFKGAGAEKASEPAPGPESSFDPLENS
jgi:23S rRNA (uridine2552-2'-O)-methyltransferase